MPRPTDARSYTNAYWIALALLLAGVLLFASFVASELLLGLQRERSVQTFESARSSIGRLRAHPGARRAAAFVEVPEDVEGVLRIPALDLRVPVYSGTSEFNLSRGAGRIEWTPRLGSGGNVGIAAHRDRAFRALKDVEDGDEIFVDRLEGTSLYEVVGIRIVEPEDVHVLRQTGTPYLTLVTCYPFDFVGSAPRRFIVHARLSTGGAAGADPPSSFDEGSRAVF